MPLEPLLPRSVRERVLRDFLSTSASTLKRRMQDLSRASADAALAAGEHAECQRKLAELLDEDKE